MSSNRSRVDHVHMFRCCCVILKPPPVRALGHEEVALFQVVLLVWLGLRRDHAVRWCRRAPVAMAKADRHFRDVQIVKVGDEQAVGVIARKTRRVAPVVCTGVSEREHETSRGRETPVRGIYLHVTNTARPPAIRSHGRGLQACMHVPCRASSACVS